MFHNHIPKSEDKSTIAITKVVHDHNVDLGIIFDTKVDESTTIDSTGHEFNCFNAIHFSRRTSMDNGFDQ